MSGTTFHFFQRDHALRVLISNNFEHPAAKDLGEVMLGASRLIGLLLQGPYCRALAMPERERDEYLPEWRVIHEIVDHYNHDDTDPAPLGHARSRVDYDPRNVQFIRPQHGSGKKDQVQIVALDHLLLGWNSLRIDVGSADPCDHYTAVVCSILEELTSLDPEGPPWAVLIDNVWYLRGVPTKFSDSEIERIVRRWADDHGVANHEDLFGWSAVKIAYTRWKNEARDQQVIHTLPDGTTITVGQLEKMFMAEPLHPVRRLSSEEPPFLWRNDGQRFTRSDDGTYSLDSSGMATPYRYLYGQLMATKVFSANPPEGQTPSKESFDGDPKQGKSDVEGLTGASLIMMDSPVLWRADGVKFVRLRSGLYTEYSSEVKTQKALTFQQLMEQGTFSTLPPTDLTPTQASLGQKHFGGASKDSIPTTP